MAGLSQNLDQEVHVRPRITPYGRKVLRPRPERAGPVTGVIEPVPQALVVEMFTPDRITAHIVFLKPLLCLTRCGVRRDVGEMEENPKLETRVRQSDFHTVPPRKPHRVGQSGVRLRCFDVHDTPHFVVCHTAILTARGSPPLVIDRGLDQRPGLAVLFSHTDFNRETTKV